MGDKNRVLIVIPDDGLEAVSRAVEGAERSHIKRAICRTLFFVVLFGMGCSQPPPGKGQGEIAAAQSSVGPLGRYRPIAARAVAAAMIRIAKGAARGAHVYESDRIRALAAS